MDRVEEPIWNGHLFARVCYHFVYFRVRVSLLSRAESSVASNRTPTLHIALVHIQCLYIIFDLYKSIQCLMYEREVKS